MKVTESHIRNMLATIRAYGFRNEDVLAAMHRLPRNLFVPYGTSPEEACGDHPVRIGDMQTISQPYTVALMLDLLCLERGCSVLEIGTGSGWNAALIREIVGPAGRVTSLEISYSHALEADSFLSRMNIDVEVYHCDGSHGFPDNAPYDRIIATCAVPAICHAWEEQLAERGIIVAPVGTGTQKMIRAERIGHGFIIQNHGIFSFVPMQRGGSA